MKRAFILGLGVSGKAALRFLSQKGVQVVVHDDQLNPSFADVDFKEFDAFIPSPGIPLSHPLYQKALASGIEIIGEAELGLRELKEHRCIGVTGTNGKTTVVTLIEHVLNCSGHKAKSLGNVGNSLVEYAQNKEFQDIVIAELSSFQIESMKSQVLDWALILNISPNHLDRHLTFEEYVHAKCRIEHCMKTKGKLYVHEDVWLKFSQYFDRKPMTFGISAAADYSTDKIVIKKGETSVCFLPENYKKKGMHESENVLAAWLILQDFVSVKQFIDALGTFSKPPHRIEFVATINGITYFNDSKSTNTDSVIKAINAMEGPVILIAGGKDKNISFKPLNAVKDKVRKILAIGSNKEKIHDELQEEFTIEKLASLEEAVQRASQVAVAGDHVLLSPGSSSFDMFSNYAHRGEEYKHYVHHLEERRKNS